MGVGDQVREHFEKWQATNEDDSFMLFILEEEPKKQKITFILDDSEVILTYSKDYPKKNDFVFSSRSKSLASWIGSVNQYIMDGSSSATLDTILSKAHSLFSKGKASKVNDNDDDDDDDFDDEDDDSYDLGGDDDELELQAEDDFERDVQILYKKKAWAKKEKEIREAMKKENEKNAISNLKSTTNRSSRSSNSKVVASLPPGKKPKDSKEIGQIFTSSASSSVLTNDLLDIMEEWRLKNIGFSATPVDDNIYHWTVKLHEFDSTSPLSKDLAAIQKSFGYNYVELDVEFTMDLYPFYPPMVKVVRPRLQGFMMGRVTSMELLKLKYWNPVANMRNVIEQIKGMLQEWARLDLDNPMNDLKNFGEGAYTELEYLLMNLGLSCDVDPRANLKYPPPEPTKAAPTVDPNKAKKAAAAAKSAAVAKKSGSSSTSAEKKLYWAKGTGYGSYGDTPTWDPNAYMAAQKEKDRVIQSVLEKIVSFLERKKLPPGQFLAIEESSLIPLLESYLKNDSLLDIAKHEELYLAIFAIVAKISHHEELVLLLDKLPHQHKSIFELMTSLTKTSDRFLKVLSQSKNKDQKASADAKLAKVIVDAHSEMKKGIESARKSGRKIEENLGASGGKYLKALEEKAAAEAAKASGKDDGKKNKDDVEPETYVNALEDFQFDIASFKEKGKYKHHYEKKKSSDSKANSEKVLRLAQEQSTLATSLPLTLDSACFIRVDEDEMDLMKMMIIGPEGTPYESGCFQFDIYFPSTYPNGPPLVNLMTTGHGSVRFNPNLYNCGKVCLSLLGTWSGGQGENWSKSTSTFLQVVVSIQSLIMVPQPYFNEPGYERSMGTPEGDRQNNQYNEVIRLGCVQWAMVDQLKNPSPGFEDVVRTHFYLKKSIILRQVQGWIDHAVERKATAHEKALRKQFDELKKELDKLKKPEHLDD